MKNEENSAPESASLIKLRYEILNGCSLIKAQLLLDEISPKEKIMACVICQESGNQELRESIQEFTKGSLGLSLVKGNLAYLLENKSSHNDHVRDFCKSQFYRLSSRQLVSEINVLFKKLNSNYTLVRYYAEELLLKIEEPELVVNFEFLYQVYNSSTLDTKRVVRKMLIKAMCYWEVTDMRKHSEIINQISNLKNDEELSKLAEVAILSIMKAPADLESIKSNWPFLLYCRQSESDEIFELAALLSLHYMNQWSLSELESEIDYLTNLRHSSHNEIRRSSRELALTIIETWQDAEKIHSKFEFLIACCESKFFAIRHRAKISLNKISAEMFFQDIKKLISWHAIGSPKVCSAIKKILFKIPADMYIDVLEDLFETQMSRDFEQCSLGYELATRISPEVLTTKSDLIYSKFNLGADQLANLAEELKSLIHRR